MTGAFNNFTSYNRGIIDTDGLLAANENIEGGFASRHKEIDDFINTEHVETEGHCRHNAAIDLSYSSLNQNNNRLPEENEIVDAGEGSPAEAAISTIQTNDLQ